MLVCNDWDEAVYGFRRSGNDWVRNTADDISNAKLTAINNSIQLEGIATDGTTVWVLDRSLNNYGVYAFTSGTRDATKDLSNTLILDGHTSAQIDPTGITYHNTVLYMTDSHQNEVRAYRWVNNAWVRDTGRDLPVATLNLSNPQGITHDDTGLLVVDGSADSVTAFKYNERYAWLDVAEFKPSNDATASVGQTIEKTATGIRWGRRL